MIFQFSPGFGTEASVPVVPRYRLRYLISGSYLMVPEFWYNFCMGLFAFSSFLVLVRFHYGIISAPNQVEPKA